MKVFIAGPRIVNELDECVKQKLENICTKQYEVFVGEADGIDSCIQKYMRSKNYKNVTSETESLRKLDRAGGGAPCPLHQWKEKRLQSL